MVDYQHPIVGQPADRGQVGQGLDLEVGERQARAPLPDRLHEGGAEGRQGQRDPLGRLVGGYAVGAESTLWPKNVGTYLPPGGAIGFQTHYTPFGKEVTDKSQIGLYFYKDARSRTW